MVAFQKIKVITNLIEKAKWGELSDLPCSFNLDPKEMSRKSMLTKKKGWPKTVKSVRKVKTQSEFSETLKEPAI